MNGTGPNPDRFSFNPIPSIQQIYEITVPRMAIRSNSDEYTARPGFDLPTARINAGMQSNSNRKLLNKDEIIQISRGATMK
jgi:hypothetical protein